MIGHLAMETDFDAKQPGQFLFSINDRLSAVLEVLPGDGVSTTEPGLTDTPVVAVKHAYGVFRYDVATWASGHGESLRVRETHDLYGTHVHICT